MSDMALRFILANSVVSTTIAGMRKLRNVEANCRASATGALPVDLQKKLQAHRWDRNPTSWSQ
jgi:aryl-alcohol dehydrogenase-like predicted oxidoreductase